MGAAGASQGALVVKNPPASAGDMRDGGSVPGSGRFPGGGQYSCLEKSMDRGAWQAAAHVAVKCLTRLKQLRTRRGRADQGSARALR